MTSNFQGAAQHAFGNGHLQNPMQQQQVPMTQQNYNPFSHTNMMSAAPPNGGQQLGHAHPHVSNGHTHANNTMPMAIPGHSQAPQAGFYPNIFPKNPPNAPAPNNFPNHFQ